MEETKYIVGKKAPQKNIRICQNVHCTNSISNSNYRIDCKQFDEYLSIHNGLWKLSLL